MGKIRYVALDITTDGDGAAIVDASGKVNGQLYAVEWVLGDIATGVDAVLSERERVSGVDRTLLTLTNADANAIYYPRYVVHSEAGAALTGTSGGDRVMALLTGKPRIVVANGGATKSGKCLLWYVAD